jgi:hypothetical protein
MRVGTHLVKLGAPTATSCLVCGPDFAAIQSLASFFLISKRYDDLDAIVVSRDCRVSNHVQEKECEVHYCTREVRERYNDAETIGLVGRISSCE